MEKVRFNNTEYEIQDIKFISNHILKIVFNRTYEITSIDTDVEILTSGEQVCAEYKGFTTIYKSDNLDLYLSNDESVYIEPKIEMIEDVLVIELTEEQKAINEKNEEIYTIQNRINEINDRFKELDYIGIKIATERATVEDYKEEIAEMNMLANEKDSLEIQLNMLQQELNTLESEVE